MKTLRFTLALPFILLRISLLFGQCAAFETTASSLQVTDKVNSFVKISYNRQVFNSLESMDNNEPQATLSSFLYPMAPTPAYINTSITYILPASAQHPAIHFYDLEGNQLLCFDILLPGDGKLVILGNTLPPGVYLYSLISDGQLIDTQRMILTQ